MPPPDWIERREARMRGATGSRPGAASRLRLILLMVLLGVVVGVITHPALNAWLFSLLG